MTKDEREVGMKRWRQAAALVLVSVFALGLAGCDDGDSTANWGTYYKDADGDFYSDGVSKEAYSPPAGYYPAAELTATSGDCNDDAPGVNPGASEVCGDGVDNNCDGNIDEGCGGTGEPPEFAGIGLAAASNDDAAFLAWTPSSDAAGYRIYYSTTPDFEPSPDLLYDEISDVSEISVTGLTPGTDYHFLVLAVDGDGNVSQNRDYKTVKTAENHVSVKASITLVKPEEEGIAPPVADSATGEYVFDGAAADRFEAGDYIVGEDSEGNGYLRRVESLAAENGAVVLQTTQAALADVIEPLSLDTVVSLRRLDAADAGVQRTARRSGSADGPVVTRRGASSGGSFQVVQTDYVQRGEGGVGGPTPRLKRPRRLASSLDPSGRLKLVAEDNAEIRPPNALLFPVKAYTVDKNGQMDIQQPLDIIIEFVGLTHPDVANTGGDKNYGAVFEDRTFKWSPKTEYGSEKPYTATFRAKASFTGETTELAVSIYVLAEPESETAYSTSFGSNQEAGVNIDFNFEPMFWTQIELGTFGGVEEGKIIAAGTFSASVEAFYNFAGEADWEKQKRIFKRTYPLTYWIGTVPVYQEVTFTLDAKLTANAQTAISASAFAGAKSFIKLGREYNSDTGNWDFVKDSSFEKELKFNLGVEGAVSAEVRLIPKVSVTFYEVATGAMSIEPYVAGSAAAEWITDGDILRKIVVSQYQMTDMSAWLGIEAFIEADLTIWKAELWRLEKTLLYDFRHDLFNLPELDLAAEEPASNEASLLLTATVRDGTNNPFNTESASWNVYPDGRFVDIETAPNPDKPGETLFTAKFLASRADTYRIFFSGNSRFGSLTRQYKEVEAEIGPENIFGIPEVAATAGDGMIRVEWSVETAEGSAFNLYLASESGVTKENYLELADGEMFEGVESPFAVEGLENGKTYYMVMTSVNSGIESEISEEAEATPLMPASPESVVAAAGDGKAVLGWSAMDGAAGYSVYMAEESGVNKENYAGLPGGRMIAVDSPSCAIADLLNGTTYYFVVTSVTINGTESDPASPESNAQPAEIPEPGDVVTDNSGLGMNFVRIPAGSFVMGSPPDEPGRNSDENQHMVTLTEDFYLMTTEVTKGQWKAVTGHYLSPYSDCDDCPVTYVSWRLVQRFIEELNEMDGRTYRLPTEAEWEYAARAGSTTAFANGHITETLCNIDPNLDLMGWYCGNSGDTTHPVGQKHPNAWGLYDMHGNVSEWCGDSYLSYPAGPVTNPGTSGELTRVIRGGTADDLVEFCRSASRDFEYMEESSNIYGTGLRLAFSPGQLSIPTGVTAEPGDGEATLSWNPVPGATAYNVYGGEFEGVEPAAAVIVEPSATSPHTISGLENGKTYYLVVTAVSDGVESEPSQEVSVVPSGGLPETITDGLGLGMTFVRIPAGTFMMGSPEDELGAYEDEWPRHEVTLTQEFYMMTTEVTQAQWETVMGSNPSYRDECGGSCPVEMVSWNDIQDFIAALNALDGRTYRLPTEAEWEYAARAGTTTAFYNGDITETGCGFDPNLDAIGWYYGNSGSTTHPVAQKQPNAWGLYDMAGNVWEWVEDDGHSSYDGAPVDGSAWVDSPMASDRVIRGGSSHDDARKCRSASRFSTFPTYRDSNFGFRLALSPGR